VTTPPAADERLAAAHKAWNLLDSAFSRWEAVKHDYSTTTLQQWEPPDYLRRVFPGWTDLVCLREQGAAAACLRHEGTIAVLPFTWPTREFRPPPEPVTHGVIAYDIDDTTASWRVGAFETGLTEAMLDTDPLAMIVDGLLPQVTEDDKPRLATLLAIETLILTMPENDHRAIRTLLALRGMPQRTGYVRLG
jgi:hypothetical protein